MQTFLPYASFQRSAAVLDKKRCWKQVVEAKQIINVLEGTSTAWQNHPAVKMWEGNLIALKWYFNCFLWECKVKRGINTKYEEYPVSIWDVQKESVWWFGKEEFHRAMRARLIEKDEAFYLPLFPNDKGFNDGKYLWPDMKTKTFRII